MDTLPATALKVLGQFLDPCDSYSCRLSSRCLSPVVSKEQSSSHIRVVANSFQHQLQQEQKGEQIQQQQQQQQQAQSQDEGKAQDQSASDGPRTRGPAANPGDTRGPGISDTFTPRSRTAASLARAAAAFGYRQAHVYVDVLQQYQDNTWQQMFGALLSCHSLDTLVIIEYSSTGITSTVEMALQQWNVQAGMATLALTPVKAAAAAAAMAAAITGHWLPHLAAAYTAAAAAVGSSPSLQHLDLQLPAPVPVSLQPLLLQLTGLKTLKLIPTRVWPQPSPGCCHIEPSEPLLLPDVAAGLSALRSLESLTCFLSASQTSGVDAQVATKLQELFSSQVMSHLTHLALGTSSRSSQLMLSAPVVSLHSLRSLTCQSGFYVDVEDAPECMRGLADTAAAAAGSGSSDATNTLTYQVAPSLTKLTLNEGSINDHEQLLKLLIGKGMPAAAAAAMTQLQHLEINSDAAEAGVPSRWGPMTVELLSQLLGLRYFKTFYHGVARAANSAVATQLLGLTVLCPLAGLYGYDCDHYPMPTVINFTSLTTLTIHGPSAVSLNPQEHFKQLCSLPNLKHFVFDGKVEDINERHEEVCKLPNGLQSLVLRHHQDYYDDPISGNPVLRSVKFSAGTFPSSLTSVKFEGWDIPMLQEVNGEDDEPSGLHNLEELSIQVKFLHRASPLLRHCSNLQRLSLLSRCRQPRITSKHKSATNSTGNSSSGSHAADNLPLLSKLCPNLQELHLKLENYAPRQSKSVKSATILHNTGHSHIFNYIKSYPPADAAFSLLWPEVTQLRGLRKLSLSFDGMLSLEKTLMPNLSALSSLSRLQHLALQLVVHLDPSERCATEGNPMQSADLIKKQELDFLDYDDYQDGNSDEPYSLDSEDLYTEDWPDFRWPEVMTDTDDWLSETLTGSCSNLRTLHVQASAIYAEDYLEFKWDGRLRYMRMPRCFRGQLLHSREHVMFMEQELPNCLVLEGKYDAQAVLQY